MIIFVLNDSGIHTIKGVFVPFKLLILISDTHLLLTIDVSYYLRDTETPLFI